MLPIEPDVRISRIRLSDWLHRKAHGTKSLTATVTTTAGIDSLFHI
jgi:hypothetical protein